MTPTQKRKLLRTDPSFFPKEVIGVELWDDQREILRSILNNEKTTVKSCHASGKTYTAAIAVLNILYAYPSSVVITTAPTFRQVKKVIWREIHKLVHNAKMHLEGDLLETELIVDRGRKWFAIGMSSKDPDAFQGLRSDTMTFVLVDEASGVEKPIFEAIDGILSVGNVRLLLIGNPTDPTGEFADSFKQQSFNHITISAFDTPNFGPFKDVDALMNSSEEERRKAVKHSYLITPSWAYSKIQQLGTDHPYVQARIFGNFPQYSNDTVISLADAEFAMRNVNALIEGERVLGVDIARFGSDKTEYYGRQGMKTFFHDTDTKKDTMHIADRIVHLFNEKKFEIVGVDDTGVGGGVTDRLKQKGIPVLAINFAQKPLRFENRALYRTVRDEMYFNLEYLFKKREIHILPDDTELLTQLTSVKFGYRNGKRIVESKDDMKKRGLPSPDRADALAICFLTSKHVKRGGFMDFIEEENNKINNHER